MRRGPLLAVVFVAACTRPLAIRETLDRTEETLSMAHHVHANLCAPDSLARAEAAVDFTRIELHQAQMRRAEEHADEAYEQALAALAKARPCGGVDRDRDTIADIVDMCPDEPEDFDGDSDEDGCRDIDPYGDEDKDGIMNLEDGCIDQPEDFDGHADDDGCPETSDDTDGDGIIDAVDQCPDDGEDLDNFKDSDGCPDLDNDEDTIPDFRDYCALIAEDLDDWDDDDGCPDPDNDADGIPDVHDACPNQPGDRSLNGCPLEDRDSDGVADNIDQCIDVPETKNGYLDEDGCPDTPPTRVKVTQKQVKITEVIEFRTGSAEILSASNPILDDVLQVLNDAKDMKLRIEGHTDSQGGDELNMKLSQQRADSVRRYLERKGVAANRLQAVGYGETKPIDTNRTASGRQNNRRVEFHITAK